jgi:outer membrane protein assembly factor BamA
MKPLATALRMVLVCMLYGCAGSIPPGRYGIEAFDLEGVDAIDEAALKACLASQERPHGFSLGPNAEPECGVPPFDAARLPIDLWAWPWTEWPLYDEAVFSRDLDRIERFYRARGYYAAHVTNVERTKDDEEREIELRVTLDEGEPVRVEHVDIEGLEALDHETRRQIERAQPLQPGDVFDETFYDQAKQALIAALREASYAEAQVTGQATIDPTQRRAQVKLQAQLGPRCKFGRLTISGYEDLPPRPIWAAAAIEPGSPFRPSVLEDAKRALYELGPFASVDVIEQLRGDVVDVLIKLVPGRRFRFAIGAGMQVGEDAILVDGGGFSGDDFNEWDLHLLGRIEHRNFLGGMRRLSVEERPRLIFDETFPSMPPPTLGNLLAIEFRQPSFLEPRTSLVATGRWDRGPDPYGGRFLRSDVVAGLGPERSFLGGRLKWSSTVNVNVFVPDDPAPPPTDDAPPDISSIGYTSYAVTFIQHTLSLDLRDQPSEPRSGAYFGLTIQHAGFFLPSDWNYVRVTPEARGYLPLPLGMVLAARARIGVMEISHSSIEIPDDDPYGFIQRLHDLGPFRYRLRGGGHNSVRGYASNTLGDVLRLGDRLDSGGLRQWQASLELRLPITSTFGAVLFSDVGDVTQAETFRFAAPQTTLGFGLRYKTIIGPIRLDAGFAPPGLQVVGVDTRQRTAYDENGVMIPFPEESSLFGPHSAIHFTIGEAF